MKTLTTIALCLFSYVATRMYMCAFNVWLSAILGAVTVIGLTVLIVAAVATLTSMLEGQDRFEIEVVRRRKGQSEDPLHKWTR